MPYQLTIISLSYLLWADSLTAWDGSTFRRNNQRERNLLKTVT